MTTTGKKEDRMEKRRTNPRSLISPFFNTALAPYTAQMPTMDMKVDMFSTPTAYCVHAAVPGLKKEDINITVQDGVLTIEAERREEKKIRRSLPSPSSSQQQQQQQGQTQPMESKEAGGEERRAQEKMGDISFTEKTDKSEQQMDTSEDVNYHHVESFYGRVTRSVQLPDDARLDELSAKYEDGVIKIEVPRTHDEKKQQRKIAIQ
jgi:HSP20 family molecular chaperone IbpA